MDKNETLRHQVAVAALLSGLAVGFGAFGAHVLRGQVGAYELQIFERATFYHFIHSIAALATISLIHNEMVDFKRGLRICHCFIYGIFIFSGSLYLLALTGIKILGAITPIGGLLFIIGWILLFRAATSNSQ